MDFKEWTLRKQPEVDSNSCGIYTLYNITRLVDQWVPSSDDELGPERQRWLFARRISEYVTTHDPVPTPSNSPLLYPIDTLTLTNYLTSIKGQGNNAEKEGKKVLEEENKSPADTDPFVGDAMDMDEPLDISEPMDKDFEMPVSPASAPSPSPMTGRERKERYKTAITSKRRGVKRSEATRSEDELMEGEAVAKRRKQSSTAASRSTMASVPTTIDQTPARATSQGFTSINQSSSPPSTGLTVNLVQREALSSALSRVRPTQPRPQLSSSSSSARPTIYPNPFPPLAAPALTPLNKRASC